MSTRAAAGSLLPVSARDDASDTAALPSGNRCMLSSSTVGKLVGRRYGQSWLDEGVRCAPRSGAASGSQR